MSSNNNYDSQNDYIDSEIDTDFDSYNDENGTIEHYCIICKEYFDCLDQSRKNCNCDVEWNNVTDLFCCSTECFDIFLEPEWKP